MRRYQRRCNRFRVKRDIKIPERPFLEKAPAETVEPELVKELKMRKSLLWTNVIWWGVVILFGVLKWFDIITQPWWILASVAIVSMVVGAVVTYLGFCLICFIWSTIGGVHYRPNSLQPSSDGWKEWAEHEKKGLIGIVNEKVGKKYLGATINQVRRKLGLKPIVQSRGDKHKGG